jgi:hypothetical protein
MLICRSARRRAESTSAVPEGQIPTKKACFLSIGRITRVLIEDMHGSKALAGWKEEPDQNAASLWAKPLFDLVIVLF